jgi:hypothetical protein
VNGEQKLSGHRDRLAVIYLRQSAMAQVREHTESTTRQYGLVEEAVRLGCARADVLLIDTDLGVSGRWGVARAGFIELVSRVCSGEVGGDPLVDATAPLDVARRPPSPHRTRRPMAHADDGRDRAVQHRIGAVHPLPMPRQQDPQPLAPAQPRLTADTVESPLPRDRS